MFVLSESDYYIFTALGEGVLIVENVEALIWAIRLEDGKFSSVEMMIMSL